MKKRVLLVDKDRDAAAGVSEILTSAGYEVETVDSPFGVACTFRRFRPHVMLLDPEIPGLNASMLICLLTSRKYDFDFGIVVHSAPDSEALSHTACISEVCGYIPRGAASDELLSMLRSYIDKIQSDGAVRVPIQTNRNRSSEELTMQ